jgi:hypothetical protein
MAKTFSKQTGSGYKEVWNIDNFKLSFSRNGFYEAGGCLTWTHPFDNIQQAGSTVPNDEYSWSEISTLESRFEPRVWNDSSTEESIIFPLTLVGYLSNDVLSGYPKMIFLHFGRPMVFAWWSCMFKALKADNATQVLQLWTAACTTTLRVHKAFIALVELTKLIQPRPCSSCSSVPRQGRLSFLSMSNMGLLRQLTVDIFVSCHSLLLIHTKTFVSPCVFYLSFRQPM